MDGLGWMGYERKDGLWSDGRYSHGELVLIAPFPPLSDWSSFSSSAPFTHTVAKDTFASE